MSCHLSFANTTLLRRLVKTIVTHFLILITTKITIDIVPD